MGSWDHEARRVIARVHASLPETATLEERMKAVDEAYPFGERRYSPYKTWLKVRGAYLKRYGYAPKGRGLPESPLERMMRRAGAQPQPGSE